VKWIALLSLTIILASGWYLSQLAPDIVQVPDDKNYLRVVSMAPSYTETIVALGQAHRLVGITKHCQLPGYEITRIGTFAEANFEIIMSLKPDLVLAVPHVLATETLRRLKEHGIEIFSKQPDSLADIKFITSALGNKFGLNQRAQALNHSLDQEIIEAKNRLDLGSKKNSSILLTVSHSPLIVAGGLTFVGEIVRALGLVNLADQSSASWPIWPVENLLQSPPHKLVLLDGEHKQAYLAVFRALGLDLTRLKIDLIVPKTSLFMSPSPAMLSDIKYFSELLAMSL